MPEGRKTRRGNRALSKMPMKALYREIANRQKRAEIFGKRRDKLLARAAEFESHIRHLVGNDLEIGGRGTSGRVVNKVTLVAALHKLLSGRTMSVTDAAVAVQKAGYKTNSKTFRVQVNIALVKRKDLFKRIARGQYTAKSARSQLKIHRGANSAAKTSEAVPYGKPRLARAG